MLFLGSAVLALATLVAAQGYPAKGTKCKDNRACESKCANGAFTVQLSGSTASFVCSEDNPKNDVQWYSAVCGGNAGFVTTQEACRLTGGSTCSAGCLFNEPTDDFNPLNNGWTSNCQYASEGAKVSPNVTGPVSYQDATAAIKC